MVAERFNSCFLPYPCSHFCLPISSCLSSLGVFWTLHWTFSLERGIKSSFNQAFKSLQVDPFDSLNNQALLWQKPPTHETHICCAEAEVPMQHNHQGLSTADDELCVNNSNTAIYAKLGRKREVVQKNSQVPKISVSFPYISKSHSTDSWNHSHPLELHKQLFLALLPCTQTALFCHRCYPDLLLTTVKFAF